MSHRKIEVLIGVGVLCIVGLSVAKLSPLSHSQNPADDKPVATDGLDPTCGVAGLHANMTGFDGPDRVACNKYGDIYFEVDLKERRRAYAAYMHDRDEVIAGRMSEDTCSANDQKRIEAGDYKRIYEWNSLMDTHPGSYAVDRLILWKKKYPDSM